jgi:hypothetical protein
MNPIDEAEHIRVLLREGAMMTHEQKMGLVAKIRENAIIRIVKSRPETLTEGHDLTLPYQAYHFIGELRKETIPLELAAYLDLLEVCTQSVDNKQILVNAICHAYAKTDSGLISGHKHKKSQSKKAKQPRGRKVEIITGEVKTIEQMIADLAKNPEFCDETTSNLWDRFYGILDETGLNPELIENQNPRKRAYKYDGKDDRKPITYGIFANRVSESRNEKNHDSRAIKIE